jgi:hypothetical protein
VTRPSVAAALIGLFASATTASARADEATISALEARAAQLRNQLHFVKELADKADVSALEHARQLFGEAETQFLLENYDNCAAGLIDALATPEFHSDPNYAQALYYLGESLFQTENYPDSKRYFRLAQQVTDPRKTRQYQDILGRLIHLADLTGDSEGVDLYYRQAQQSGALKPELIYVYAKWTANRQDLPHADRNQRAINEFALIQPGAPYYPQALYYRGALTVDLGKLDDAIPFFQELVQVPNPKKDAKTSLLRDLGHLALGRIYYEENKASLAIEQYRALPVDSPEYMQALFERAQVYLKLKDFNNALQTSDTLLLLGKDSPVLPDAQILQGNLLLKIGEVDPDAYEKAIGAFRNVVQTYSPVRDQIRVITERPNPVAYFDDLLKRDPATDFTKQLPRAAQGFVDPTSQVAAARRIPASLNTGRKTIEDSNALARKMLAALARGGLVAFPQLAEANSRAVELSNSLLQVESEILHEQVKLLNLDLPADQQERLQKMEADHGALDKLFLQLPHTQEEYEKRLTKFRESISGLELRSFEIRRQIDTTNAVLAGLDRYWHDTVNERHDPLALQKERDQDFQQMHRLVDQLDEKRKAIDRQISQERIAVGGDAAGGSQDDKLRQQYVGQFEEMKAFIAQMLPSIRADSRPQLDRLSAVRSEIETEQGELTKMRDGIQLRGRDGVDAFRRRIVSEQVKVEDEEKALKGLDGSSGQLIGQIAVDLFRKVEHDFYSIVLRGDVGLVDVAWSRKQQRTETIEKYAKEKDQAQKVLEDQFKEVLGDAD